MRNPIIAALDVPEAAQALKLAAELKASVGTFKIGGELFTSAGPDIVRQIRSSGGEFDSRSSPPFAGYSLIQVFGATKIYWARKMYSFRELDIGVLTVSVAIAACSVADCGEGVVFSVLTSAGGCISAMCSYRIPHWSLKVRSPKGETRHSNVIRIAAYDRRAGPI